MRPKVEHIGLVIDLLVNSEFSVNSVFIHSFLVLKRGRLFASLLLQFGFVVLSSIARSGSEDTLHMHDNLISGHIGREAD